MRLFVLTHMRADYQLSTAHRQQNARIKPESSNLVFSDPAAVTEVSVIQVDPVVLNS